MPTLLFPFTADLLALRHVLESCDMKTIMITGAASGIGAAIAERLATPETNLLLHTGSNAEGLKAVATACESAGSHVQTCCGDLADPESTGRLAALTGEHLDGLVLNAGFPDFRGFNDLDGEGMGKSIDVIANANYTLLHALRPSLLANSPGKVIGISSFLAHKFRIGGYVVPASATAKAALEAMLLSFAAENAPDGLCANVIVPGYIKKNAPDHTPPDEATLQRIIDRIPAGRLGLPNEVADLAAFLLSKQANYITGQRIHIDGGLLLQ